MTTHTTQVRRDILELFGVLRSEGHTRKTRLQHATAWRFWIEFATHVDLGIEDFGKIVTSLPSVEQVREEDDILALFAIFVVFYPRIQQDMNTAEYANGVIANVRTCYEAANGRRPGTQLLGSQVRPLYSRQQRTGLRFEGRPCGS